jgi:hypothetical protein
MTGTLRDMIQHGAECIGESATLVHTHVMLDLDIGTLSNRRGDDPHLGGVRPKHRDRVTGDSGGRLRSGPGRWWTARRYVPPGRANPKSRGPR